MNTPPRIRSLSLEQRSHFLQDFREARATALRDAEGFPGLIHSIERLGSFLCAGKDQGLGDLARFLETFAADSPLSVDVPDHAPAWHAPLGVLLDQLRQARNDAAHEGVYARHLTETAVQVAIMGLELEEVECVRPEVTIESVIEKVSERAVLVVDVGEPGRLVGILTAFDLL